MIANGTETKVERKLRTNEFQIFRENTTSCSLNRSVQTKFVRSNQVKKQSVTF